MILVIILAYLIDYFDIKKCNLPVIDCKSDEDKFKFLVLHFLGFVIARNLLIIEGVCVLIIDNTDKTNFEKIKFIGFIFITICSIIFYIIEK